MTWQPLVPYDFRPLSLLVGVLFGILTTAGTLKTRLQSSFPKIVWTSFFVLHSGLFGTVGPLRLTNLDPRTADQWIPFTLVFGGVLWQYQEEFKCLPKAVKSRAVNMFNGEIHLACSLTWL